MGQTSSDGHEFKPSNKDGHKFKPTSSDDDGHEFKPTPFPKRFENIYSAVPSDTSQRAERICATKYQDLRDKVDPDGWPNLYTGQMSMEFNDKIFMGTGTIINIDTKQQKGYILTAAHNVVHVDKIDRKTKTWATNLWFRLKTKSKGDKHIDKCKFSIIKSYIYPKYWNNPIPESGFDAAICVFTYDQTHKSDIDQVQKGGWGGGASGNMAFFDFETTNSVPDRTFNIRLVGFPAEKNGEMWGMDLWRNDDDGFKSEYKDDRGLRVLNNLITYTFIDTSGGQSGSAFGASSEDSPDFSCCIAGIHVGGSEIQRKNYATKITKELMNWISVKVKKKVYPQDLGGCTAYKFEST